MLDPSILVGASSLETPVLGVSRTGMRESNQPGQDPNSGLRILAATIELLTTMDGSDDLQSASSGLSQALAGMCEASQVIVLWRRKESKNLEILASSGQTSGLESPDLQRMTIAAGEEISVREPISVWPTKKTPDQQSLERYALMAVTQLGNAISAKSILGVKLTHESSDVGVLLVVDAQNSQSEHVLLAIANPLASKIQSLERLQPTGLEQAIRGVHEMWSNSRKGVLMSIAALLCLILLLPLPYHVSADLELQPVKRRFVAVPFDGPLDTAHVRPGDVVQKGQLLAKINPREIEYELAGIRAELNRATQEKKGMMVSHDFAGGRIAALEQERLRLQSDLLQYRHDNLEIRSPIVGIVVTGDWKQSEGMPLSRGETLFEIAPLGRVLVELAISESDIAHVREGMDVGFYVHAIPHRTLNAKVASIRPSAELRNQDNVFICEVMIEDSDNVLRPGMHGRARISSDRHPLGWNLFHKAYYGLRQSIGW